MRNRLKVESTVQNAPRGARVQREDGSLDALPLVVRRRHADREPLERAGEIPAETDESRAMSKDLKRRGFRFVGPDGLLRLHAGVGMVNDHVVDVLPLSTARRTIDDPGGTDGLGTAQAASRPSLISTTRSA